MKTYVISTDAGSATVRAASIAEALFRAAWIPSAVTTATAFADWLVGAGGFGSISEDGRIVARMYTTGEGWAL